MKIFGYLLSLLLVCSLVLTSCKDDDDATELTDQQKATKSLSEKSPWNVKTVMTRPDASIDDATIKALQVSFGVTGSDASIAPGSFTASGASDFFSATSGAKWAWSGSGTSEITLTGASVGSLTNIQFAPNITDPTSVTLTFERTQAGGRVKGLGTYTVTLE